VEFAFGVLGEIGRESSDPELTGRWYFSTETIKYNIIIMVVLF
jgi:hypothetical protein